jgi:2-keto-4-pentenoate hydratase
MARDLPTSATPWTGARILEHVACAYPALEIADDRRADYAALKASILTLVADNAWNQGLVLGPPCVCGDLQALADIQGIARIDGQEVGRGFGRDVLGNPADALAWLANSLVKRRLSLRADDLVTTGSLVKSQFPVTGQRVEFLLPSFGSVALSIT